MTWTQSLARRGVSVQTQILAALVALSLAIIVAVVINPDDVPFTSLMVPLLLGSILLGPRRLPWFVVLVLALLLASLALQSDRSARIWGAFVIQLLMCAIVLITSLRRTRLGVGPAAGESMFVDLRDRISRQTGLDRLPPGWYVETALESAGGTEFAGDFLVATRPSPRAARDRPRRRVRQGRGGRRTGPAPRRGLRWPAGCPARAGVPARRERLPAPPGLGGGVRHRDPPVRRPGQRRASRCARPGIPRPRSARPGRGGGRRCRARARSWAWWRTRRSPATPGC